MKIGWKRGVYPEWGKTWEYTLLQSACCKIMRMSWIFPSLIGDNPPLRDKGLPIWDSLKGTTYPFLRWVVYWNIDWRQWAPLLSWTWEREVDLCLTPTESSEPMWLCKCTCPSSPGCTHSCLGCTFPGSPGRKWSGSFFAAVACRPGNHAAHYVVDLPPSRSGHC